VIKRILCVVILLLLCTIGHFTIPHTEPMRNWHEFLFKATYVPIILAALWFGVRGGLATSLVTTALYLVHVQRHFGGHFLSLNLSYTLDIVLYNGIALATGLLSQAQVKARERAERLAEEQAALRRELEASYQALQRQTEELLEVSEQLRRSERLAALGELTASIAHEIRNPLGGISGAAEIVGREGVAPEVRAEFSDILRKETARLNQAVQNILTFARGRKSEVRETDLGEVARRVVRLVAHEAQQHSVSIAQEVPPGLRVETDPLLVEHILLNLVLNAVQAMPNGGAVTLSARNTPPGPVALTVRDTGPGISPENLGKLFQPFFTTKTTGSGLGLAIAKGIVEAHGGSIHIESAVGKGSTCTVKLPIRQNPIFSLPCPMNCARL
jgi:two-component system sensor histidine kinase HydH